MNKKLYKIVGLLVGASMFVAGIQAGKKQTSSGHQKASSQLAAELDKVTNSAEGKRFLDVVLGCGQGGCSGSSSGSTTIPSGSGAVLGALSGLGNGFGGFGLVSALPFLGKVGKNPLISCVILACGISVLVSHFDAQECKGALSPWMWALPIIALVGGKLLHHHQHQNNCQTGCHSSSDDDCGLTGPCCVMPCVPC